MRLSGTVSFAQRCRGSEVQPGATRFAWRGKKRGEKNKTRRIASFLRQVEISTAIGARGRKIDGRYRPRGYARHKSFVCFFLLLSISLSLSFFPLPTHRLRVSYRAFSGRSPPPGLIGVSVKIRCSVQISISNAGPVKDIHSASRRIFTRPNRMESRSLSFFLSLHVAHFCEAISASVVNLELLMRISETDFCRFSGDRTAACEMCRSFSVSFCLQNARLLTLLDIRRAALQFSSRNEFQSNENKRIAVCTLTWYYCDVLCTSNVQAFF